MYFRFWVSLWLVRRNITIQHQCTYKPQWLHLAYVPTPLIAFSIEVVLMRLRVIKKCVANDGSVKPSPRKKSINDEK
jgi:hypothetical protein